MNIDYDRLGIKDKHIGVYGIGGSTGRSLLKFLKNFPCHPVLYDDKFQQLLEERPWLQQAYKEEEIDFAEVSEDLLKCDLIVTSPGVPLNKLILRRAREKEIMVISEIELAINLYDRFIIAITGTNGKTTTVSLLGEILKKGFTESEIKIAGNIGQPLIEVLPESSQDAIIVAEVSSFQLAGSYNFSPDIAILLNFAPDHLDWHPDVTHYRRSKEKIFNSKDEDSLAIINGDNETVENMASSAAGEIKRVSLNDRDADILVKDDVFQWIEGKQNKLIEGDRVKMAGRHNLMNAGFAVLAALELDVSPCIIREAVYDFTPPSHRMEIFIRENDFVGIDDSKATNPHAVSAALASLNFDERTVVIVGGQDRNVNLTPMIEAIINYTDFCVVIGELAEKIKLMLNKREYQNVFSADSLHEAVEKGLDMLNHSGQLILSPGAPSWDMFENYRKRGKIFKSSVEKKLRKE